MATSRIDPVLPNNDDQELFSDPTNPEVMPSQMPQERMMEMMNRMISIIDQQEKDREGMKDLIAQHREEMSVFRQEHSERRQMTSMPPTSHSQQSVVPDLMKKMANFYKFAPPPFEGAKTPLEAEKWFNKLEKVLETVKCEDKDRIPFAEFLLEGDAESWWMMEKRKLGLEKVNWENF